MKSSKQTKLEQFQADLLKSVKDMKLGRAARSTVVAVSTIAEARTQSGLSQSQFAALIRILLARSRFVNTENATCALTESVSLRRMAAPEKDFALRRQQHEF